MTSLFSMDGSRGFNVWPPLPSFTFHVGTILVYWSILVALRYFLKNRKPFDLRGVTAVHNLIMTALSLVIAAGLGWHIWGTYKRFGLYATYCGTNTESWDDSTGFWINCFYLSKFYEFVDTVILVLKKRDIGRLHLIHHSTTGIVGWLGVHTGLVIGWITAFNNCFVHAFMYWYYFKQAIGQSVWWKKYLTTAQIIQFFLDALTSYPFAYFWFTGQPCRGSITAWTIANLVVMIFVVLFVEFFIATYSPAKKAKAKAS